MRQIKISNILEVILILLCNNLNKSSIIFRRMNSSINLNIMSNSSNENSLSPPHCLQIDLNQALEEGGALENDMHSDQVERVVRLGTKKKNLSNEQNRFVFESLLLHQKNSKLSNKGAITYVVDSFSICTKSLSRIWRDGKVFCTTNNFVVTL